jgi:hypothetical protein
MLEKHQLKTLSDAVIDAWKNVNVAKVNGLDVRPRASSRTGLPTSTRTPKAMSFSAASKALRVWILPMALRRRSCPLSLPLSPPNMSHRLRIEGRAVVLVIDAIKG